MHKVGIRVLNKLHVCKKVLFSVKSMSQIYSILRSVISEITFQIVIKAFQICKIGSIFSYLVLFPITRYVQSKVCTKQGMYKAELPKCTKDT